MEKVDKFLLRSLDLFTGYGGITLALEDYCKPIAYVEIEEYAQRIIAERMADGSLPRAPILADVKNIEGKPDDCDIIIGGSPCQDISVAGNGKGLAGERSGLFYEITRLTKEIQPKFLFLENVPAIRTRGLQEVIKEFSEMGYDCRWTIVSAASVGAPHVRQRWFLLAKSRAAGLEGPMDRAERSGEKKPMPPCSYEILANPKCNKGGAQSRRWSGKGGKKAPDYLDSSWWVSEPNVDRVVDGIAFRVDRVKALGNGVVPLQAKKAFEYLMGAV